MRTRVLLVFIIHLCLDSCSSTNNQATSYNVLEVDPELMEASSFLDHVKKVRIIPLETRPDVILGNIWSVLALEDRFFVFDLMFSKSVFIYDSNGAWINKICSIGKGPGEYANPVQLAFDPFNGELVINDPSTRKILRFDLDGNFKSELKLEFGVYSLGFVDSDTYAFSTRDDNRMLVVATTDHEGKNKKIVLTEKLKFEISLSNHFHNYKESLLYIECLNDTVYQISKDTTEPYRYIDYLDLKVTKADHKELLSLFKSNRRSPALSKSQAGNVLSYLETDKMIKLSCTYKGENSSIWINKLNNQQLVIQRQGGDGEPDPLTELVTHSITTDDSGNFVSNISTDAYQALFKNDKFNEYLDKGIIEIEDSGFEGQVYVTLESNPILAVIEMK